VPEDFEPADRKWTRIRADLLESYGAEGARKRDRKDKPGWKLAERAAFLHRLQDEGCRNLLEIGAGTGQDSLYFAANGLDVVTTDLSPAMVAVCRAKGLDAHVMDFAAPSFPAGSFDAVHGMNCLLHVPNAELPGVLAAIRDQLRPGGLFYLGAYSGDGTEGTLADDDHVPPRFFSWRTDEQMLRATREWFDIVDFHAVETEGDHHFQSLTLRRPVAEEKS
jgi:SAM-dependent methyltransferase